MSKVYDNMKAIDGRIARSLIPNTMSGLKIVDGHAVRHLAIMVRTVCMTYCRVSGNTIRRRMSMISKALQVARAAHGNQCRKSGEPYIVHLLWRVSIILADLEMNERSRQECSLHDVVEDTKYTDEDIKKNLARSGAFW